MRNALPYRTHALAVTLLLLASAARAGTLVISADQAEGGAQVKASYGIPSDLSTAPVRFRVTSSNTAAATVPNEISVQPGSKVIFNIQTGSVAANTSVTVEVSPFFATARQQERPDTDSLVVLAPPQVAGVSLSPTSVVAGQTSTGTVSISRAAAAGGVRVALASMNTNAATVPASITVASGASSATFTVSSLGSVAQNSNATITGTLGITQGASLTVQPAPLEIVGFTLPSQVVSGGPAVNGQLSFNRPAAAQTQVALASNSPNLTFSNGSTSLTIFATAGQPTTNVSVRATGVPVGGAGGPAQVTATVGNSSRSAATTVAPAALVLSGLFLPDTVTCDQPPKTAQVSLNAAAPQAATVALSSSSPNLQIPPSVTVPAGQLSASFEVSASGLATGAQSASGTVTATLGGTSKNDSTVVFPPLPEIASLTVPSPMLSGGPAQTATVVLAQASAQQVSVGLGRTFQGLQMPNTLAIPAGQTTGTFEITPTGLSEGGPSMNATVTASAGLSSRSASVTINSPPPAITIASFTIAPDPVVGGNSTNGTVTLSAPAPAGGVTVFISILQQRGYVSAPSSFGIVAGQTSGSFEIETTANVVFSDGTPMPSGGLGPGNITVRIGAQPSVQDFFNVRRP